MRKLVVMSLLTPDGVMQSPGGKEEDTKGSFEYGGWQAPFFGDYAVAENLGKAGALLLGRKTYDIFASYWERQEMISMSWGAAISAKRSCAAILLTSICL